MVNWGALVKSVLTGSPFVHCLSASHPKVQLGVHESVGGLFSISNTQMCLNTFSQEKGGSGLTNAFNINGNPASLSFNCLETLQMGMRSLSPISFLLITHPSELLQAYANRRAMELDLLVFCMSPTVLMISLFKIKCDEVRAVSSADIAKLCMELWALHSS